VNIQPDESRISVLSLSLVIVPLIASFAFQPQFLKKRLIYFNAAQAVQYINQLKKTIGGHFQKVKVRLKTKVSSIRTPMLIPMRFRRTETDLKHFK